MYTLLTKETPHITKRVIEDNYYYELWSDGIIKFCATTDIITTSNGYISLNRPSVLEKKQIKNITVTNLYCSLSDSISATVTAQDNTEGKIIFYFRIGKDPVADFKVKLTYEITSYDPALAG